jgi:hypothetical protein
MCRFARVPSDNRYSRRGCTTASLVITRRHTGVLLLTPAESCGALDDELVA